MIGPGVLSGRRGRIIAFATCGLSVLDHTLNTMIAKWHSTVIDCPDPETLATFYQELLGMVRVQDDPGWITIGDSPDRPGIAFQQVENYRAPEWPGQEVPQQMHFDVQVDDLDEGERAVLAIGATDTGSKHKGFRVYLDPAGHPFCLVL